MAERVTSLNGGHIFLTARVVTGRFIDCQTVRPMYEVKGDRGQVNPQIEIVRLVIAINDDLCQTIAYYELFEPSGLSEPLIERVNQHLIHEGFNVVSEAFRARRDHYPLPDLA
jgi:hypothetical protein